MNDIITIKQDLTNIGREFVSVIAEYNALELSLSRVGALLGDTSLWQADSQSKCAEIHELLRMYIREIRPIHEELKSCIANLDESADSFSGASRNVGKLWD
jgi:hypothetical protein